MPMEKIKLLIYLIITLFILFLIVKYRNSDRKK